MDYNSSNYPTDESNTSTILREDNMTREVGSFIEPRDPSITKPWMRPRPTHGTNLCSMFERESCSVDLQPQEQHLRVYLRLKPHKTYPLLDGYEIPDDSTLIASSLFEEEDGTRMKKIYKFSHIFKPLETQIKVFDKMIKDNLKKFVDAHEDFTLMTYGTSGSGKTFSLMGTDAQPGVIPRCLEFLFAAVQPEKQPRYKPADGNNLETLSSQQAQQEIHIIENMVDVVGPGGFKFPVMEPVKKLNYRRMSRMLSPLSKQWEAHHHTNTKCEVWVSFAEIYNEGVYDLLRADKQTNAPPPQLKLVQVDNSQPYIKGIRWVCARSGVEAYALLEQGRRRLHYAHTNLNKHSSRSHCIFTMRLLTYSIVDNTVSTSSFRLCDLAGSERAKKTGNTGTRMDESRKINKSLHVLERCLATMRSRQRRGKDLPPYRDSKLTKLLQNALSGKEDIAMLVNINPESSFMQETQHVLEFSALARQIQVVVERKSDPSVQGSVRMSPPAPKAPAAGRDVYGRANTSYLLDEIAEVKDQLASIHEFYTEELERQEREVRKEVSDKFLSLMQKSADDHREQLQQCEQQQQAMHDMLTEHVTAFYKKRLESERESNILNKQQLVEMVGRLQEQLHEERNRLEDTASLLLEERNRRRQLEDTVRLLQGELALKNGKHSNANETTTGVKEESTLPRLGDNISSATLTPNGGTENNDALNRDTPTNRVRVKQGSMECQRASTVSLSASVGSLSDDCKENEPDHSVQVLGFHTSKKEKTQILHRMEAASASVPGSRRKLFSRRLLDEVAASQRSVRCLYFQEESPGSLTPPPLPQPYGAHTKAPPTRYKTRNTRKKLK